MDTSSASSKAHPASQLAPSGLSSEGQLQPGVKDSSDTGSVKSVGVVGAGIMGRGIAAANVLYNVSLLLTDADPTALAQGAQDAAQEILEEGGNEASVTRLLKTGTEQDLTHCDLIIESVVENAAVKQEIFARLESLTDSETILASNTSTIPISRLAATLTHPERFCGIHFLSPVRWNKVVEVIRGDQTNEQTIAKAVEYVRQIGRAPIVAKDGPGFLINRLLLPYFNEAILMLCEGAELEAIDRAAKAFGMILGPFEMFDLIGLDTAFYAGMTMWKAFPDRVEPSPVVPALIKLGRLGRKSGSGFYSYNNEDQRPETDAALKPIVDPYVRPRKSFTGREITSRLFLLMLLEATRALEEEIVGDFRDIDFGVVYGLGFPAARGGLLRWADSLGSAQVVQLLKSLEHLGKRAEPTPILLRMAKSGGRFYPDA